MSHPARTPAHRRLLAVAAVVIALLGAGMSPAGALEPGPEPATPAPSPVDAPSAYLPATTCDPTTKPGARALIQLLIDHYGVGRNSGITRDCSVGGTSEHKEGRAVDWGLRVDRPAEKAAGDAFTRWLTADGPDGEPGFNARRLGVMYVIWNEQIWAAYDTRTGWRHYYGASPHTDHVHVSLSWDGAYQRTSWWDEPVGFGLVRTVGDASVFLVSGGVKYPIARADLMSALSPLGSVAFVSQAYLDARRTGPAMGRVVRAPDGTISFVDAGIRLPLASCAQVEDFGSSCAAAVPLEARQIARLHPGPRMTNVYATTSGKTFLVTGGTRREVSDTTALAQAGLPTSGVTLLESGIGYLPLGTPVTRDGQVLRSRTTATTILSTGGQHVPLTTGMDRTPGIATLPTATLDEASLRTLTLTAPLNPIVKDTTSSRVYLLTTRGKVHLTTAATIPPTVATATPATLGRIPDAGTAATPVFFKSEDNGTVYYLHAGQRRPLRAWADLITLNGGSPTPTIHTLPGASPALLAPGPFQVAPGSLIMSPDNGTVYLADGPTGRITVGSFAVTAELGATRLASIPATDLAGYTLRPGMLTTAVACGTERYLGLSGRLHPVTPTMATTYRLTFTTLDPSTCAALPRTTQPLDRFLRTPDGTIHHITNGTKHPITSYTRYTQLGGTPTNTLTVTTFTANRFPTGPAA